MATTTLFVEILVIGALAEVWIGTGILWVGGTSNLKDLAAAATSLGPLSTFLAVPLLALTYALGWNVNFVSERLFKPYFQRRVRDSVFQGGAMNYDEAKMLVTSKGSSELAQDIRFDRHIIRIARSNIVNFSFIALAILPHLSRGNWGVLSVCEVLSILIAAVSFLQWLSRYRSYSRKIKDAASSLSER